MKLLIHIGTPKTGTTALQSFLFREERSLTSRGLYPSRICLNPNHAEFGLLAVSHRKSQGNHGLARERQLRRLDSEPSLNNWKIWFTQRLKLDIAIAKRTGAHTYLISSEFLSLELEAKDVRILEQILRPLFDEIQILVYLRDQFSLIESLYSTRLKNGTTQSIQEFSATFTESSLLLNYDRLLSMWGGAFGWGNILARDYAPYVGSWDIVSDFIGVFMGDTELYAAMTPVPRLNAAISRLESRLILEINRRHPRPTSYFRDIASLRGRLVMEVVGSVPGPPLKLSSEELVRIRTCFAHSNEKIRTQFELRGLDLSKLRFDSEDVPQFLDEEVAGLLTLIAKRRHFPWATVAISVGSVFYLLTVRLKLVRLARGLRDFGRPLLGRLRIRFPIQ